MSGDSHNQNMGSSAQKKQPKIKLVMPFKTYEDELREKHIGQSSNLTVSNIKTRMCKSLEQGVLCRYGEECQFAHSLNEFVTINCFFKDSCRFIRFKSNGKMVNNGSNICMKKHHLHENQDEFMERTGLVKYKTKHEEIDVEEDKEDDQKSFACDRQTNYNCAANIKPFLPARSAQFGGSFGEPVQNQTTKFGGPVPAPFRGTYRAHGPFSGFGFSCATSAPFGGVPFGGVPLGGVPLGGVSVDSSASKCEIVLRVPKELAVQALELAMNNGNRYIRVEVIE